MTRVLVVDDDPAILRLLADVLREEGYAVATANNGARAPARACGHADQTWCCSISCCRLWMGGHSCARAARIHPARTCLSSCCPLLTPRRLELWKRRPSCRSHLNCTTCLRPLGGWQLPELMGRKAVPPQHHSARQDRDDRDESVTAVPCMILQSSGRPAPYALRVVG